MSNQGTLVDAIENLANIQEDLQNLKEAMGQIEENNPVIGDVEDSVKTVTKIVSDVKSHNYVELISDGIELGNELSHIPGDIKKFVDEKGGVLLGDAEKIKDDVVKLVSDVQKQFSTITADLQAGGIQGFVKAFQDVTEAIKEDIKTGQDIGHNVENALDTLKESGEKVDKGELQEQQTKDQARDIGSHMNATDVKDASGKDGQQSPNTPGQDVSQGGQDLGM